MAAFVLSMTVSPVKRLRANERFLLPLLASYHESTAIQRIKHDVNSVLSIIRWEVIPNGQGIRENWQIISVLIITGRRKELKPLDKM